MKVHNRRLHVHLNLDTDRHTYVCHYAYKHLCVYIYIYICMYMLQPKIHSYTCTQDTLSLHIHRAFDVHVPGMHMEVLSGSCAVYRCIYVYMRISCVRYSSSTCL